MHVNTRQRWKNRRPHLRRMASSRWRPVGALHENYFILLRCHFCDSSFGEEKKEMARRDERRGANPNAPNAKLLCQEDFNMFCGHFWDNWLQKLDVTPESDRGVSEVDPVVEQQQDPRDSLRISCKHDDRDRDSSLSHLAFSKVIVSYVCVDLFIISALVPIVLQINSSSNLFIDFGCFIRTLPNLRPCIRSEFDKKFILYDNNAEKLLRNWLTKWLYNKRIR